MDAKIDYRARCHCGRVRFSFRSPEITSASRCDCSLCVRRAAWLSPRYIPAADFTPHENADDLGCYLWNEEVLANYFCKICGIFTYIADGENGKDGYRVNLGCVEGLDTLALDVKIIDGRSLPVVGTENGMKRRTQRVFGRSGDPPPARAKPATGLVRRWQSIRIGHRAMLGLFGGFAVMIALVLVQARWNIESAWPNLLGMGCMIVGLLYAYTRRCPSCGVGDVVRRMGPLRHCEECGTQFLNDRFF